MADVIRGQGKLQTEAALIVTSSLTLQGKQFVNASPVQSASLRIEFDSLTIALKEFIVVYHNLAQSYRRAEKHKLEQLAQYYYPDILEKELKLQAEFDRQIEKLMKRLVALKELKRFYATKSVKALEIEATNCPPKSPISATAAETNS